MESFVKQLTPHIKRAGSGARAGRLACPPRRPRPPPGQSAQICFLSLRSSELYYTNRFLAMKITKTIFLTGNIRAFVR